MDIASRRSKRAVYQSPLREEQAQRTGERILEALAEHLAEQGWETFSIARVAERARVSEPTVYRHFPNREALLGALSTWLEERRASPSMPDTIEGMPAFAHELWEHFHEHAAEIRVALHAGVGREVRERGQKKHDQQARAMLTAAFEHLPPEEARAAAAVLRVLLSRESWEAITHRLGVAPHAASAAAAWASQALIDAAHRDRKEGRRTLVRPETIAAGKVLHERSRGRHNGKKRA
jgi:AcrR family transcriptional regulator